MKKLKCSLKAANWQIGLIVEGESPGEETPNRTLQRVPVHLPGAELYSLERANASQYEFDHEEKVTCLHPLSRFMCFGV